MNTVDQATNTSPRRYKKRRTRLEWRNILKDKEDNGLTIPQVLEMYDVSEASYYKWASVFRAEDANLPITEYDVINLIKRSLADFDNNIKRIDEQEKALAEARKDILNKKAKLEDSLATLTGAKLKKKMLPTN